MVDQTDEVAVDLPTGPAWAVLPDFERFDQVDDVFNRAFWDPEIATDAAREFFRSHREPLRQWRNASGFGQRGFVLVLAMLPGPPAGFVSPRLLPGARGQRAANG